MQSPGYRERTRSEQRHLLVELELDDSVVLTPARVDSHAQQQRHASAHMQARDQGNRRVSAAGAYEGGSDRHYPRYANDYAAFPDEEVVFDDPAAAARRSAHPQSAKARASYSDSTMSSHNTQKKVLSSRHQLDPTPVPTEHEGRQASPNPRATPESSPLTLIASSLRQNAQLRDQLVAQLQQEVSSSAMNVSHLDRFSPPQLSSRLVKMLNKLRSLSLSIVETQLYFRKEVLESAAYPAAIAHVERELQAYLLQMIASDVDFLSCFTPLIRIFDCNGVSLVRNPLVEGLSLDSSELLLCSCNHVSSSSYGNSAYSSSSAASSSPLFQLLAHKLEAFALYMRRHVPSWQVLPPDRVAVALLHLIELENRANATKLLPSYLRPPPVSNSDVPVWDRNQPVQFSNPISQVHHQPSSWTDFADEEDGSEKETLLAHPRSSFVAWDADADAVPSLPCMQSAIVNKHQVRKTIGDPLSCRRTSSAQPMEASIPSIAETKQQSATKASAKKRKGSSSEATVSVVSARGRQVESNSPRLEKNNSRGSEMETSDAKSGGGTCHKSEAMVSVDKNGSRSIGTGIERLHESLQHGEPTRSVDCSAELENVGIHVVNHDGSSKSTTDHSPRQMEIEVDVTPAKAFTIAITPDSRLEESALKAASEELVPRHESKTDCEVLGSGELSPSRREVPKEDRAYSDQSTKAGFVEGSIQQNSTPLVSSSDQTVLDEANSYQEKVPTDPPTSDDVSKENIFEYSSERTLSMIASALDLLPSFGHLESTVSLPPATVATLQVVPDAEERIQDDEISFESATASHPLKASETPLVSDFEDTPTGEDDQAADQGYLSRSEADTSSSEPVLEKIYSLCRDVQVAAFDMSYHFDNLVAKELKLESPIRKQSVRSFPSSSYEPPLYLERELKMLRRYFRPWRDFALEQTEAKRFVRRRAACHQVFEFVYRSHRARQLARMELEKFLRNAAADRIQKDWRMHRLRVRATWQKAEFRSAHMAFKRFLFYVRISNCRRRREGAKETIHRWWRRRRDTWRKQEAERTRQVQHQQRRYQAAKEVKRFFRETILRQRLARISMENQQILFKSQLHSLKARQESEKRRKTELKKRREQESRMKSALSDLESKWKRAEHERSKLLDHHKRVLGRYQHLEGKKRQQLAQLKITTFLDTCLLYRKIKKVESERERNQVQWRLVSREKELLERETEQGRAKDKVQLRVLHRKLAKLEDEKTCLTETQQMLLETHKQRLQQLQEHVARTTIKAFIDARLIHVKSRRERLKQLRVQKQIMAEKYEQERMVREDISERERVARVGMDALGKLLERAQEDIASLVIQQKHLIAEKELEAAVARRMIEATLAEKSQIIISKWLSHQIRTSRAKAKFEREKAELARAVDTERQRRLETEREKELLELKREEEKRSRQIKSNLASLQHRKSQMKQQMIADKRQREAATSTICFFVECRIQSSRRKLAAEQTRLQEERQRCEEIELQQELQRFLVNVIIDTRFKAEKLASACVTSTASSIYQISVRLHHKHTRLKHLHRCASTRKIQRCWRSWIRAVKQRQLDHERVLKAQSMRRHACARKIQRRRLQWKVERMNRQAAEQERQERSLAIINRVCCRKIQRRWRQWCAELEEARMQRVRKEKLGALYRRVCARKIQHCYRRWQHRLLQRRLEAEAHQRAEQEDSICRRSRARRIQRWWKRAIKQKQHQRVMEILAEERRKAEKVRQERLRHIRNRSLARKIQRQWRKWRRRVHERQQAAKLLVKQRLEAELAKLAKANDMRQHSCARKIQKQWRLWRIAMGECRKTAQQLTREYLEAETARRMKLESLRQCACARKIQKSWRQWQLRVQERREAAKRLATECLEAEAARRLRSETMYRHACAQLIQREWQEWRISVEERRRAAEQLVSEWLKLETVKCAKIQSMRRHVCAGKIQRCWRKWSEICRHAEEISAELDRIHRRVCGRRILKRWREWRKKCEEIRVENAAILIETVWRGYYTRRHFAATKVARRHEESRLYELKLSGLAWKIQRCWGRWLKQVIKARGVVVKCQEDELIRDAKNAVAARLSRVQQEAAAVAIQAQWAGYRCRIIYVRVRKQLMASYLHAESNGHEAKILNEHSIQQSEGNGRQEETSSRTSQATRLGFRLEIQQWVCHQLPVILSEGMNFVGRLEHAARVVQRAYQGYRRCQQLHFHVKAAASTRFGDDENRKHHALRFYFSSGRAWMESEIYSSLRLRFDALMTQKLLSMFDPGAHTALELREALDQIAEDVQSIVDDAMKAVGIPSSDSEGVVDVDEMDLPSFCALTRKMGRIRSMHKRNQLGEGSPVYRASPPKLSASQEFAGLTIFDAVASASVEDAQFLFDQGADITAALDPISGRSPLHMLAFCGESYRFRLEMLEFLVNRARVDVNALEDRGETPLMLFAICGHLELMEKLFGHGADVTIANKKGQNVLHQACEQDQVEICEYLHAKFSLADGNAGESDPQASTLFLHDADVNGRSPLHILAEKGFIECAKQFIFSSENPHHQRCCFTLLNQRDADGRTPLHAAILSGHVGMTSLLLENSPNAFVDTYDKLRRSPVHLCVDSANAVCVIALLSACGANLSATDERGDTPLHYAALSGRELVVQALLDRGADPSVPNSDWEFPAQVAAAYGHFDCSRLLLNVQKVCDGASEDIRSLEAELEQQQASSKSYYYKAPSPTASMIATGGGSTRTEPSAAAVKVGY